LRGRIIAAPPEALHIEKRPPSLGAALLSMLMPSRIATWLQAFALALPAFTTSVHAQQSPLARFIHQTRLDNGLAVIVVENHAVPLATVLVAVRNGAFTQEPTEEGLAHLYEHILFRSYQGDPNAFGRAAGRLNAASNGATSEEVVYFFLMVSSKNVDGAIDLIAGLLQDARLSNQDLKEERPIVLNELQRDASDPEKRLRRQVNLALWGSSWSRKDPGGDSTSLAGITLDRLKQTYTRYYIPNNAALIVTGDVSSEQVFEKARAHFRDWKRGPDPFVDRPIPPIARRAGNGAVMLAHDVRDVTIRIAFQGPSVADDTAATYAADALFDLLNDPASAFQQRLVTAGPFESVSGAYYTSSHTGSIEIVGKTTAERAQDALVRLLNELETLDVLEGVSDEDLAIAKKHREVQMALELERIAGLAPSLAYWWSSTGLDYRLAYTARMAAQTSEDLRRFASTYVVGRPRVIGVLAPPETTDRLAMWLRQQAARRPP
jgi:zinc protease